MYGNTKDPEGKKRRSQRAKAILRKMELEELGSLTTKLQ